MRYAVLLPLLALLLPIPAHTQDEGREQRGAPVVPANIHIRVLHQGRPYGVPVRVQLHWPGGGFLSESRTDDRGEATLRGSAPGNFRIVVLGAELEGPVQEDISLMTREVRRYVFLNVTPRTTAERIVPGAEATIATWALQIPKDAEREYERGDAAMAREDWARAQRHFARAVEAYPQYASAYNNLGVALLRMGEEQAGREALEQAVEIDPSLPGAQLNLARLLLSQQRYSEAEQALQRIAGAGPPNPEVLSLLALCYANTARLELLLTINRRLHALAHDGFPMAHLLAARALLAMRRPGEARQELKLFLEEAPQHARADEARLLLQSLPQP